MQRCVSSWCPTFLSMTLLPRHLDLIGKLGVGWDGHDWENCEVGGVTVLGCQSVLSALSAAGDWKKRGSYHTAQGTAVGPQTGERCWSLLSGLWRAVAPLMKPWCAAGGCADCCEPELLLGEDQRVVRHSDDEPLFGMWGGEGHCVGELRDPCALQMEEQVLSGR